MNVDDVRLTAQLVVQRKVHCVSDASVEALAKRVLELEARIDEFYNGDAGLECLVCGCITGNGICTGCRHGTSPLKKAVAAEREACAQLCVNSWATPSELAEAIRARGLRSTPTLDDVKRGGA